VFGGFSRALSCHYEVKVVVECPCDNDDGWLMTVEDSIGASLTYFSYEARHQSRSSILLACLDDCWHVARSASGGSECGGVP
jgi:hypothetical protein